MEEGLPEIAVLCNDHDAMTERKIFPWKSQGKEDSIHVAGVQSLDVTDSKRVL